MRRSRTGSVASVLAVIVASALVALAWPGGARAMVFELVSVGSDGTQSRQGTFSPSISADGRYVAFVCDAGDLVPGDMNLRTDVFVRDRLTGTTSLVSIASDGTQGNQFSCAPSISADGRYVAFASNATNLVPGDTNSREDVFVRDRQTGTTSRVSVASDGTQGNGLSQRPQISADGRYVAFESESANLAPGDANGYSMDIFVFDRLSQTTERVSVASDGSPGNGYSAAASISADGRYVAFESESTNLAPGDANGWEDVFVRDRVSGTTEQVSVDDAGVGGSSGSYSPSISADGRYVAFTWCTAFVWNGDIRTVGDIFVRDRVAGTTECLTAGPESAFEDHSSVEPSISADGRYVSFMVQPEPTWLPNDLVVHDRLTGTTEDVCLGNYAGGPFPFSADGRYVACTAFMVMVQDAPADTNSALDVYIADRLCALLRGTDRYDTAIRISKVMFPAALPADSGLVVAPGETFQEALCGAPLAAAYGGPVLLTYKAALANNVKAELRRLAPQHVFCIGLSTTAVNQVKAALPAATVTPINGVLNNVYDMSRKVADALEAKVGDMSGATAIVTPGANFPDAIGVSPLACARLWPIILTDKIDGSVLHPSARATFTALGITKALKVGTYATLPGGVTGLGNLSGSDRWCTNRNVAAWAEANAGLTFTHIAFATGDKFPDALAAGPYLAQDDGILLLSPLLGPVPAPIAVAVADNRSDVQRVTFIACIQPVVGQVRALLP